MDWFITYLFWWIDYRRAGGEMEFYPWCEASGLDCD